jgi:hypothetical protein
MQGAAMKSGSIVFALALLALASHAGAQEIPREAGVASDLWSDPNPGIRYLDRRTTAPSRIHAVIADLSHPGVRVVATPHRLRWRTVGEYAHAADVQVAVNGGFWAFMQGARGIAAGGGTVWPRSAPDPDFGILAVDREGHAYMRAPGVVLTDDELLDMSDAISGRPWLVRDGELVTDTLDAFETSNDRAPRTAVGLSEDGTTLFLAVVDGRQAESRGMTLYELGRLMMELGAHEAMNLDGGASSEMFVERLGGVVSVPSSGRWEVAVDELLGREQTVRETAHGREVFTRGREQEVINHLGIVAPPPELVPVRAFDSPLDESLPAPTLLVAPPAPLAPRVHLGTAREWIAPAIAYGAPTLAVLIVGWLVRRFRRRRMRLA